MNPAEAADALEKWFLRNNFRSHDPYAALGEFEKKFSWMPRHPRLLFYKLAEPKSSEKFFVSATHAFLLKGACLRTSEKPATRGFASPRVFASPHGFAARLKEAKPQAPFGLPFRASGEQAGEPLAITCLFRAGAFFDACVKWRDASLERSGFEAANRAMAFAKPNGGIAFSRNNPFTPYNVAAEGAAVFAQASALAPDALATGALAPDALATGALAPDALATGALARGSLASNALASGARGYAALARRCLEFVESSAGGRECFWRYSPSSRQFDVVHNAMIYCSLAKARRLLKLSEKRWKERFAEFCVLAERKPKNLWDYAKLLEAKRVYGLPTDSLWREACGLYDEGEGAFRFAFQKNVGTGRPEEFYGRHNALMYYSACLLSEK